MDLGLEESFDQKNSSPSQSSSKGEEDVFPDRVVSHEEVPNDNLPDLDVKESVVSSPLEPSEENLQKNLTPETAFPVEKHSDTSSLEKNFSNQLSLERSPLDKSSHEENPAIDLEGNDLDVTHTKGNIFDNVDVEEQQAFDESKEEKDEEPEILDEKQLKEDEEKLIFHQRHLSMVVAEADPEDSDDKQLAAYREQHHVFVLTEAGKPVFALHGNEDKWSPLTAVIVALVSCVKDRNDNLKHIIAGSHKFVFLVKNHLILVGVCATTESVQQMSTYLEYVYDIIISLISGSRIKQIYSKQHNFDLRRLISDSDIKFFSNLCYEMRSNPKYFLQSIQCFQISSEVRDSVAKSLQLAKSDDLVFAILISNGRVVCTCHMKEHPLRVRDLQVLLNYINISTSFQNGENHAPICLPHFNPNGFLYAHISYLEHANKHQQTCLILLSADPTFFIQSIQMKEKVVQRLNKTKCLSALESRTKEGFYRVEDLPQVTQLRHFIYKHKDLSQFTCPRLSPPYTEPKERDRLFANYEKLHGKVHDSHVPLKLLYTVSNHETMLAWIASGFELYAAFCPLITKQQAIQVVEQVLRWIKSKEDELFMSKQALF